MTEFQRILLAVCCGYVGGQIITDLISMVVMFVDSIKAKRKNKQ